MLFRVEAVVEGYDVQRNRDALKTAASGALLVPLQASTDE